MKKSMSHNGRVVLFTEPFWAIPFNLVIVFATLFMLELGLSERQVGFVQTVLISSQILSSFFSGALTDLIGRKKTSLIFDTISWGGACLIWAFANSFTAFALAAILSGVNKICFVSFNCLLTEDATNSQRIRNFSGLHLMVLAGGLFTPIGGIIVDRLGLIQGTRALYFAAAVIMTSMFFVRHILWKETGNATATPKLNPIKNIMDTMNYIKQCKEAGLAFFLQSVNQFIIVFKPVFYFAFLKSTLGVEAFAMSLIPVSISILTMIVLLVLMPRIKVESRNHYISLGLLLSAISTIFFVLAVWGGMIFIILSVITDGLGTALIRPLIDSAWADSLDSERRASQLGTGNFLIGLLSIPAGILAAELYNLNTVLPFVFVSIVFIVTALVNIVFSRKLITLQVGF